MSDLPMLSNARPVRIGVISDTHIPQRWKALPTTVFGLFQGVDLILHAGDVGELWVLDQLGQIAPVVAVHGNDETDAARAALPFLQTLTFGGTRIVLTHGHLPDFEAEMAMRATDDWAAKFDQLAKAGAPHGAHILVSGHTHIPTWTQYAGIWMLNPGAIASGSYFYRQSIQTVAVLTLCAGQAPAVTHYDLARPDKPHVPPEDWSRGFDHLWRGYEQPIYTPEVLAGAAWLQRVFLPLAGVEVLNATILPLVHRRWAGDTSLITAEEAFAALRAYPAMPEPALAALRESSLFGHFFAQ